MKPKIDTVFFDIGGVLVTLNYDCINRHIAQMSLKGMLPGTDKEIFKVMESFFGSRDASSVLRAFQKGKISSAKFFASVHALLKSAFGYSETAKTCKAAFLKLCEDKIPENVKILRALSSMGKYKVGIISDNEEENAKIFFKRFQEVVNVLPRSYIFMSQEVGMLKDEGPGFFEHALRKTKSKPQGCTRFVISTAPLTSLGN